MVTSYIYIYILFYLLQIMCNSFNVVEDGKATETQLPLKDLLSNQCLGWRYSDSALALSDALKVTLWKPYETMTAATAKWRMSLSPLVSAFTNAIVIRFYSLDTDQDDNVCVCVCVCPM